MLENSGFEDIIIEKYTLDSEYNRNKMRKYFGPLALYSNLWETAVKPK